MLNALCPLGPWCFQKDSEDTVERIFFSHT